MGWQAAVSAKQCSECDRWVSRAVLNQTLGYKAGELDGLNVSVIMPPPFAQRHNGYLRNAKSGQHVLLNRLTKVLALRKDKTVLPMDLKVTKISQGNEAALYMGVMHPIEEDDGSECGDRRCENCKSVPCACRRYPHEDMSYVCWSVCLLPPPPIVCACC